VCHLSVPWWLGREPYTDEHGMVRYKEGNIRSHADFTRITPPDVDWARRRIEALLKRREGTRLGWSLALPTAASIIVSAMGFEAYYTAVQDDPTFVEEFLDRIEAHSQSLAEKLLSYRPDAIVLGAFVCFKSGLMMSRDLTEQLVFSRIAKHINLVRAAGIPVIIHSDGDNMDVMARWIELGVAGYHPVEPSERHSIYDYKERWGDRITLFGNIDCASVLSRGTPDEVVRDTLEHLNRLSVGGGYVCGSSHDVDDNVPIENLRAMAETVAGFRRKDEG
jgi:uroporphyrinogen decarboxylase